MIGLSRMAVQLRPVRFWRDADDSNLGQQRDAGGLTYLTRAGHELSADRSIDRKKDGQTDRWTDKQTLSAPKDM